MPREHRVTRLLKGRRSLAHWLSDCRRLLCNRAGSAAARLNQSDIVFHFLDPVGIDENLARVWLVPNARHVCELSHSSWAAGMLQVSTNSAKFTRRNEVAE
jgi:hypothetical protein